jgi:hypothetical protein
MRERQLNLFNFEGGGRDIKKRNTIIIPIDTLILLAIVGALLIILSFSIGVERGRRIALRNIENNDKVDLGTNLISSQFEDTQITEAEVEEESDLLEQTAENISDKKDNEASVSGEKKYIIQVATYLKEKIALDEARKLEESGYSVSVSKKGEFIVLFVSGFENRKNAQKAMQSLRKRYKDCFIRRLI